MHLNVIEIVCNSIALFWVLTLSRFNIHYLYYFFTGKITPDLKPFNCDFCMMFWCAVIASVFAFIPYSHLTLVISLPVTLAFLTNKYNNEQ